MTTHLEEVNCENHKQKGTCAISGCENSTKARGKCVLCGVKRYRKYCASHKANGTFVPRSHGKKTTKTAIKRRKELLQAKELLK